MRRRDSIILIGTAATWPVVARAQQTGKVPRVGFLGPARTTQVQIDFYQAFVAQLEKKWFS
jgi:hypothetical protein